VTATAHSNGGRPTAGGSPLVEKAAGRFFATSERVTTADEAKALLASDRRVEAVADNVQRAAVVAVPVLRALSRGTRFGAVPWALVASTTISVGVTMRTGVREIQVLNSLVTHRIERATEQSADPALARKVAVALYLDPDGRPDVSDRRLGIGRLVTHWVVRGVIGRETRKKATKALEAAEGLDVRPLVDTWSAPPTAAAPRAADGG
jgi:hypothetical protein